MRRIVKSVWFLMMVLGVALPIFFYTTSRKFKALTATIEASASVVELREPIPELAILYKGKEIEQLHVLVLKITNTGKLDIEPEDFVGPLHFNTGANVVDAKIVEKHPNNLGVALEAVGPDKVAFTKSLFKVGEWFSVRVTLLSAPELDFSTNRIVDLRPIVVVESSDRRMLPIVFKVVSLIMLGALVVFSVLAVPLTVALNVLSMRKRAKEASLKSNMHTVQLAVEDFSTMAEGLYPATINATVAEVLQVQGYSPPASATQSIAGPNTGDPATGSQIGVSQDALVPSNFTNPMHRDPRKAALGTLTRSGGLYWSKERVGMVWYVPIGVKEKSAAAYEIYGVGTEEILALVLRSGS